MKKHLIYILLFGIFCSCTGFLEPLPNGSYNEENYDDYPKIIRGYIEKAYDLRPTSYISSDYIGCDGLADNMTWSARNNSNYKFATGSPLMSDYSFADIYKRDYQAIFYCNLFLKDNIGLNTRYLLNAESNKTLQRALHGDAYALRAWYLYDLLKFFGGRSTDGHMLGVPIFTEPMDPNTADMSKVQRATYEECINQIIRDCDSALVYLPEVNREFPKDNKVEMIPVTGSVRYGRMDGVSVRALKATALLTWASPAFNPYNDLTRWDAAAKVAKEAIDHKLNNETEVENGFNPVATFIWRSPNSPEAYYVSNITKSTSNFEESFYPKGFGGSAKFAPTQELVDAFPMASGYPIDHPLSGYDPQRPYFDRDPRFYATIFYNGSTVERDNASDVMYTFDTTEGGNDAPGRGDTSPTGYYIKRFIYTGWNKSDGQVNTLPACIFFYRWTHMLLTFAEAANNFVGPIDETTYGMSARQALAYVRSRKPEGELSSLGEMGDKYLDEVALMGGMKQFDELVKNEWRLETCFEGHRFHNVRRWARSVDEINVDIHRMKVTRSLDGRISYEKEYLESRRYPSLWLPLPYLEVRRSPLMVQNEGWESWN